MICDASKEEQLLTGVHHGGGNESGLPAQVRMDY